jgi:poly-beta-1,6-N-acetyl-D-glucosamine synthase
MLWLIILCLLFGILSLGITSLHFASMLKASSKPWNLKIDKTYLPKVSLLVPTYNESDIIQYKLLNLIKIEYPKELLQIIIVDSKSNDSTLQIINDFIKLHPDLNIVVLSEAVRNGKSAALNHALSYVEGEIIIVSDADCLYPSDILKKSIPYLSDPRVGAISGPKLLLNTTSTVANGEQNYLKSMNLVKLGESKKGFTALFEGGFSAYKKNVLSSFDPYKTGSDDCGTIIKLAENSLSALLIPEAEFYTTFPVIQKERFGIKIRRANQLIRVFGKYFELMLKRKVKTGKNIIFTNIMIYLFCPFFFLIFVGLTIDLFVIYPYLIVLLLVFMVPKVTYLAFELFQNYVILIYSSLSVLLKKDFLIWKKPADRQLFDKATLIEKKLI